MEAAPPTYEKATLVDPWDIIARYIPSNDLCSATLVCSRWHSIFTPHLWGNPASHFGVENDRVYLALTKFKRTLQTARLLVRSLTHTLQLPPAHAEIYNGPHSDWLRDVLERLPNLQSLIVRSLAFFDYSALQALKYKRPSLSNGDGRQPSAVELPGSEGFAFQPLTDYIPSFGLRLLDASRCSNVTSSSLAQALGRLENLLYLDLSFTYPARDASVLRALRRFSGLQVLKLRGIHLSDEALSVLAPSIARRVRSLDVRNNDITDRGVRNLLSECFITDSDDSVVVGNGRRSPALLPYIGRQMLEIYQGEDFESFIRSAFTGSFVGRLAMEDAPEGGITHLYIAGNQISAEGVSGLLRAGRLHVLDAHSIIYHLGKLISNTSPAENEVEISMPGVEKLTPILAKHASSGLTFLRIAHGIVTKDSPNLHMDEIVQGRVELGNTSVPDLPRDAFEMDITSPRYEAFELPAVQTPRYELPGDPMQIFVSPATNDAQHRVDDETSDYLGARRGSAFAPEVLAERRGSTFAPEVLDPASIESDRTAIFSPVSAVEGHDSTNRVMATTPVSPFSPAEHGSPILEGVRPNTRTRTYSSVAYERKARLNAHNAGKHNLHPAMLPHLNTLVLTDIPPFSPTMDVAERLICFVRQCAEEASLARAHAQADYAHPPGRRGHAAALKHSADRIFALKRIVLEMAPDGLGRRPSRASQWHYAGSKSVTEDRDSETLWSAAETDFSFFGEEDYGFPSLDSGRYAHSAESGKEVNFSNGFGVPRNAQPLKLPTQPRFDTIALLSAFRKERKATHQRSVAGGAIDPDTGHWDGIIELIHPGSAGFRADEAEDYYGNRFSNGYLYR